MLNFLLETPPQPMRHPSPAAPHQQEALSHSSSCRPASSTAEPRPEGQRQEDDPPTSSQTRQRLPQAGGGRYVNEVLFSVESDVSWPCCPPESCQKHLASLLNHHHYTVSSAVAQREKQQQLTLTCHQEGMQALQASCPGIVCQTRSHATELNPLREASRVQPARRV